MKHGESSSSPNKRKKNVIYIDDSDSEGEAEVLVTPTKRQRSPQREEDIKPRSKTPKVEYYQNRRLEQDVKPFVGLGRAPNTGASRNVKPSSFGRDVKPNVKPVSTAMGQLSVSPTLANPSNQIMRLIEQLGGRKRGKIPVLFRFNP